MFIVICALVNSSKLEPARAYCMIRLNSTYFYVIVCYAHMKIFLYAQYTFFYIFIIVVLNFVVMSEM